MSNTLLRALNRTGFTANGAITNLSTGDVLVDLFGIVAASRGKDIKPLMAAAIETEPMLAAKMALWLRDVRGGAGERGLFYDFISVIASANPALAIAVIKKIPEVGRFDDLFQVIFHANKEIADAAIGRILFAYAQKNEVGLAAKWTPRKGPVFELLRKQIAVGPKQFRKFLVENTRVVETAMCNREWEAINYSHVPSRAMSVYMKAFYRHDKAGFENWKAKLKTGEAKVNAKTLYPYEVIANIYRDDALADAQWKALPDYCGESNESIIPVVDVSGSMGVRAGGGTTSVTCMDVSMSLGVYLAERLKGPFKDHFITFSSDPVIQQLIGDTIKTKIQNLRRGNIGVSTDFQKVFKVLLASAVKNRVPVEDMPTKILVLSDMEFNVANRNQDTNFEGIKKQYEDAGYPMPQLVFWNLNARVGNNPVTAHESGTAMVSGFSPAIMGSLLGGTDMSPRGVMLRTLENSRYDLEV